MTITLSATLVFFMGQLGSPRLSAAQIAGIDRIDPASLQANVEFLASDLLEGRNTPSKGLDLAAEYIASQFRKSNLEPAGDKGFFQITSWRSEPSVPVKNVIGILRGTDPVLRDTFVLVSAHYDHIGQRDDADDRIFNGANDDASGVSGVIEIARGLSGLKLNRSVVFLAFYGEEKGLVGSRFYVSNPRFPLKSTIAAINLEQIGRTDDTDGLRIGEASMTGFDFSDLGPWFASAGRRIGVKVTKHTRWSDAFFSRSDNQAFADAGIPSGTLCTAYMFPDYHQVGDHADKLDYTNMAKIVRMVASGVASLADSKDEPRWNAANEKAAKYLRAWRKLTAPPRTSQLQITPSW